MKEIILHLRSVRDMCNNDKHVYRGINVALKMLRNEQKFNDLLKNKDAEEII